MGDSIRLLYLYILDSNLIFLYKFLNLLKVVGLFIYSILQLVVLLFLSINNIYLILKNASDQIVYTFQSLIRVNFPSFLNP